MENMETWLSSALDLAKIYAPRLIGAIVIWIVGSWMIKVINKGIKNYIRKKEIDASLAPFLRSLVTMLLKVMLVLSILSTLGMELTSFVAILGAAGLAVGMALSGTLQNFAGGVMILIFKPFKAGDVIDAQGHIGVVKEIQIFNTLLTTPDNKVIIIPNGGLANSSMTNYSAMATRRVDMSFGIAYGDSIELAKETLKEIIDADERILKEPAPQVVLSSLGDSSVNFAVRMWVNSADYWNVFFEMNEKVYNIFAKKGLNIPFPQMDVHLHQQK